jgi:hypothetical protein
LAFWQAAPGGGGNVDSGVATPKQVCTCGCANPHDHVLILRPTKLVEATPQPLTVRWTRYWNFEVCVQVFARLAEEGYQITASRVPLSRERIPEAADLDTLQSLHTAPPEGGHVACTIRCVENATA